jgi:hypothetical protein
MTLLNAASLAATLDAVNDALFGGRPIAKADRAAVVQWLVSRLGAERSYECMAAPTPRDFASGIRLFTGERIVTRAGTAHVLGEEANRALLLLGVAGRPAHDAVARAEAAMSARLSTDGNRATGMYCCGSCSVALWRNLAAGGFAAHEAMLIRGLKTLRATRDRKGGWGRFPANYTLLALTETDLPAAVDEMRHAAPRLERGLKRRVAGRPDDVYAARRRTLAERVLARC